jgi:hypothetical protein
MMPIQALTTREGLSAWWTSNTQGQSKAIAAMTRHMTGTREGWLAARLELLEMPPM